jgi:hypothetical protein
MEKITETSKMAFFDEEIAPILNDGLTGLGATENLCIVEVRMARLFLQLGYERMKEYYKKSNSKESPYEWMSEIVAGLQIIG